VVPAQNKTAADGGIGAVKVRPRYASKGGVLISEINSSPFPRRLPHCVNISKKFERVAETPDQYLDLTVGHWRDLDPLAGLRAELRQRGKPIGAIVRATLCQQSRNHLPLYVAPLVRRKRPARRRQQLNLIYSRHALSEEPDEREFFKMTCKLI
jgi:hypothetical protein